MRFSAVERRRMLDATRVRANSGVLKIYTGPAPAGGVDDAVTGTLLVTLTLNATAFGAAAGSSPVTCTANAVTSGTGVAAGTAGWARLFESDGTTPIVDLAYTTDFTLTNATVAIGGTVSCSSCGWSWAA